MKKGLSYSAVDLFCGAGGLTHGMLKANMPVNAGIDIDATCKYPYEANNDAVFIEKDIKSLRAEEIRGLYPKNDIKVLVGCAPCQPFSRHTQKNKTRNKDDKWDLLYSFIKVIEDVQPEIISMENVPEIIKQNIFVDFTDKLKQLGYSVFWKSVFCPDYGIPQKRTRLVLLASKFGEISLIKPTHDKTNYKTVQSTIGKLNSIGAGETDPKDKLHTTYNLAPINLKRIKQSKPDGTWEDWDKDLVLECHKKKKGKTYSAVYGRMNWNKPSPTITTQFFSYGTGRFGHPEQNRALSLREGAMLQTFPKKYKFVPPGGTVAFRTVGTHIGNAVPVKLGEVIGKSIKNHIEGYHGAI